MTGALATPYMIERLVWLLRRASDSTVAALRAVPAGARDLVLWRLLLAEHAVPGAGALTPDTIQLLAFLLTTTGRLEVVVPDGAEWRDAVTLATEAGADLASSEPTAAEVRSYVDGGFLDAESSRRLLRFASPDTQAALASGFLVAKPEQVTVILDQPAGRGRWNCSSRASFRSALNSTGPS